MLGRSNKMKKIIALIAAIAFFATIGLAKQKVTLLMDWFPQGNQSGFWQAQFDNQYPVSYTHLTLQTICTV